MRSFLILAVLLLPFTILPQVDESINETSELTAEIKEINVNRNESEIKLEVSNSSNDKVFIATNPKGYNGLINSSLEIDRERETFKVLSHIKNSETICGRPVDSSSVNLLELPPQTKVIVYYRFSGSRVKVQPFCVGKLIAFVDLAKVREFSISLGYFENEPFIAELTKNTTSVNQYTFFPEGNTNGKRLVDYQKIIDVSKIVD